MQINRNATGIFRMRETGLFRREPIRSGDSKDSFTEDSAVIDSLNIKYETHSRRLWKIVTETSRLSATSFGLHYTLSDNVS